MIKKGNTRRILLIILALLFLLGIPLSIVSADGAKEQAAHFNEPTTDEHAYVQAPEQLPSGEAGGNAQMPSSPEGSGAGAMAATPSGSISGRIIIDGLQSGQNALALLSESFEVFLCESGNPAHFIDKAAIDAGGFYIFEGLTEGSYTVCLIQQASAKSAFSLPGAISEANKFAADPAGDPLSACTNSLQLGENQALNNIDAVINALALNSGNEELPSKSPAPLNNDDEDFSPYGLLTDIWDAALYTTVKIDGFDWFVMKKQTVSGVNCALLLLKGSTPMGGAFGTSTTTSKYEGSLLQDRMGYFYGMLPTMKQIALKPNLGNHASTSAFSLPTTEMAGSETKDIMFALSFADVYEFNGNRWSPLLPILKNHYYRFFLRTAVNNTEVHGVLPDADTIDAGIHYLSTNVRDVAAVWVSAMASCNVTVHYVDENGAPIGSPSTAVYPAVYDEPFELSLDKIPGIPNYEYFEWKTSLNGAAQSSSVPVQLPNVKQDAHIYLVYKQAAESVLSISKKVTGAMGNKSTEFEFKVYFFEDENGLVPLDGSFNCIVSDSAGAAQSSSMNMSLVNGMGQFKLKHGQHIEIEGVPLDCYIRIVEAPDVFYSTSFIDSLTPNSTEAGGDTGANGAGYREMSALRHFSFENERCDVPETGVASQAGIPYMALLACILIAVRQIGISAFIAKGGN
ncbi:MAG: hypothetical protein FWG30_08605 [Eubacteriaceae bacterium]|nr:hypothetical protein [Eubacteriaceae bacterium]